MARRKKRMKLPNGFGSIKYLGAGRRNPYGVYPPVDEWTKSGPVTPKALAYTATWEEGYELLTAYNMEKKGQIKVGRSVYIDRSPTFAEVYEKFFVEKFSNPKRQLSASSKNVTRTAFKNCSALHNVQMGQIRYDDLQSVVNSCPLKHASLELIVSLMHQMYGYALKHDIVDKDYSAFLCIPIAEDDESGEPFSDEELRVLWEHSDDSVVQMILIMIYSGYRISAYVNIAVDFEERSFCGGVKTSAGKNRTVPIHPCIFQFVRSRSPESSSSVNLLGCTSALFRNSMYSTMDSLGISRSASGKRHTPHDCRHTFSRLCEKYKVNENDRKRMLGHSFGNDITNGIYGHRSVEDLREEIEKIKVDFAPEQ